MNNFTALGLSDLRVEVLEKMGFDTPTPIQSKAIPLLLTKDPTDFIGLAQTGTGKTAAFGLPLLDLIDVDNPGIQALILAPTRELIQQTAKQLETFAGSQKRLNVEVVFGGAAITNQIKALKKNTQVLAATPGRLQDLIDRKAVNLSQVKYVVLDEADEMLNMGFQEAIDQILTYTQHNRVTWLFSATMPGEIRRIVKKYMKDPLEVSVDSDQKSNKDITHQYIITKTANKLPAVKRFLDMQPDMRGVMFCRTKRETQQIADELSDLGYGVEALHGDLSQSQRDTVMKRFKTRSMQLLIATDVAARGIDVNDLTHVIHHTLPEQLESYTHRSGRTGRAGKKGISLAFINPRETKKIQQLEKKIKVIFDKVEVPSADSLKKHRIKNWATLISNTRVDDNADDLLKEVEYLFEGLSKEEILKRLITTQLDHISVNDENLNETHESGGRKSDGKYVRYFINVGNIDGMTAADVIHFLSDVSGISRDSFGNLSLQKSCSYFDVKAGKDKGLSSKFESIEMDGRDIRVNRDEDKNRPNGRPSDRKKKKKRSQFRDKTRRRARY